MEYPLDPNTEIFKWGPLHMHLFHGDLYQGLFVDFSKEYPGYGWPKHVALWKDGQFVWLHEFDELRAAGEKLFLDRMLPLDIREESRGLWNEIHEALLKKEKEVAALDFSKLSNGEFIGLWDDFDDLVQKFWMYSCLPELANYGSVELLEKKLRAYMPQEEIPQVLEILTAPEEPSFFQEEEMELGEATDLAAHQAKYFWLHNGYDHIGVLPVASFDDRKRALSQDVRKEYEAKIEHARNRKQSVIKKYSLPEEIVRIADAITDGIVWQDKRKKDIWIYLHYRDGLLDEAARRLKREKQELLPLFAREIGGLLRGKEPDFPMQDRNAYGFFIDTDNNIQMFGADKAERYWKAYVETSVDPAQKEFRGIVASKGKGVVRGTARIVTDSRNPGEFHEGDILVTAMTTPEYVFLMKKAGAVVTDAGGLTSHAAIVSRELGVPCIVGTKIATSILKDDDMVEVDAAKGVVRKI